MTDTASVVSQVLANLGNDRRRLTGTYINSTARRGEGGAVRRVLSDVGFLQAVQVTYVNASRNHVHFDDTSERRSISQIVLVAYGLQEDYKRLASQRPEDRLLRHSASPLQSGVEVSPYGSHFVMSGSLGADTASAAKTQRVVRAMTTNQGPAPHFIVTRKGDVIIGPSIDGETTVLPALRETAIFVAVESALLMPKEDHAEKRYSRIFEAPMPLIQSVTLATLVNKLRVAVGATTPAVFATPGLSYAWGDTLPSVQRMLFDSEAPAPVVPGVELDYSQTIQRAFFALVEAQGSYDLATQVWLPAGAPPVRSGREEARTAIGQVDTAGAESAYLGAYATIAAEARADDMQAQVRSQMFVSRHRVVHNDADDASASSAHVAEVGASSLLPTEVPTNVGPHTYDFTTGLWGDNKAV